MDRKAWRDFSVFKARQAQGDGLPLLSVQQSVRGKVQEWPGSWTPWNQSASR